MPTGEFEFSDYGVFGDAIGDAKHLNEQIEEYQNKMNDVRTILGDQSVFMGPVCDITLEGLQDGTSKMQINKQNFDTVAEYIQTASNNYQSGDQKASKLVLQTNAEGKLAIAESSAAALVGNTNADQVYNYLASQGFNKAAICGILANIQHESGFNPQALGDKGTSYGICQWHNSRWTNLKNYCAANGLDSTSLSGQLPYLVHELKTRYPGVYNTLVSVPNTPEGAYQAAYKWTVDFEVPANRYVQGQNRGNTASSTYWNAY